MRANLKINTKEGVYELNGQPIENSLLECVVYIKNGNVKAGLTLLTDVEIETEAFITAKKI